MEPKKSSADKKLLQSPLRSVTVPRLDEVGPILKDAAMLAKNAERVKATIEKGQTRG